MIDKTRVDVPKSGGTGAVQRAHSPKRKYERNKRRETEGKRETTPKVIRSKAVGRKRRIGLMRTLDGDVVETDPVYTSQT